jgi:hypothetical protein
MRQGNGSDLLGVNDPRGASIGIIYVTPTDERKNVLAAILTQEKLGRKQVAVALPAQNKAFQRPADFDDLRGLRRKLQSQLVFIIPGGSGPAEFARQRRFTVYSSLDNYASALSDQDLLPAEQPKKKIRGLFGSSRFKNTPPLPPDAAALPSTDEEVEEPVKNRRNGVRNPPPPRARPVAPTDEEDEYEYDDRDDGVGAALLGGAAAGAAFAGAEALYNSQARSTPHLGAPHHDEEDVDNIDAMNISNMHDGVDHDEEDDDEALSLPSPVPMSVPAAEAARNSATGSSSAGPSSSQPGAPEAIDLQPVRPRGRSTLKLPQRDDAAVSAGPANAAASSRTPQRTRNSGKLAGAAAVGSTAAASAATAHQVTGSSQPPTRGNVVRGGGGGGPRRNRPNRPWWIVVLLILGVLVVLFAIVFSLAYAYPKAFNFPLPSVPGIKTSSPATVTITPDSKVIGNSYVIVAIPNGVPNADQHQIAARTLSSQQTQTGTVTGTGHNQVPATTAKGTLTFLNGSFASSFTVGTNTPIPAGGISVYLDAPAVIPAATTAGFGSVTVPAHAATAGAAGNIAVQTISGTCCVAGGSIQVHNGNAFTGGQDAKDYHFVQQGDVDAFVSTTKAQLTQQANSALKGQLKSDEQLAQATNCPSTFQSSNQIGDQGVNIPNTSVTVTVTCKAEAYDQNGMNTLAANLLQQKAKTELGTDSANYTEQGTPIIHSQVQQINADQSVSLIVTVRGLWVYQFSNEQKLQLAKLIAGKPVDAAKTLLTAQMGVQDATISTNNSTLPTDPSQISIVIQGIPSLQDTSAPTYPTPGSGSSLTPGAQPARGDGTSLIDFAMV